MTSYRSTNPPLRFLMPKELPVPPEYHQLCKLWTLRILLNSRIFGRQPQRWNLLPHSLSSLVDLANEDLSWPLPGDSEEQCYEALERELSALEATPPAGDLAILQNADLLADWLGLLEAERRVFQFLLAGSCIDLLTELFGDLEGQGPNTLAEVIAAAVDLPLGDVAQVLKPQSKLLGCGLLRTGLGDPNAERDSLRVLEPVARAARHPQMNALDLLAGVLRQAPEPLLGGHDLEELAPHTELFVGHLGQALSQKLPGVNLLLSGAPGTGKTQYARYLASQAQVPLFEVLVHSPAHAAAHAHERLANQRLAQALLSCRGRSLLLFDHADEVLGSNQFGPLVPTGFLAQVLETNPVPTIWVVNDLAPLSPALLSRFDFCLRMPRPTVPLDHRLPSASSVFNQEVPSMTQPDPKTSAVAPFTSDPQYLEAEFHWLAQRCKRMALQRAGVASKQGAPEDFDQVEGRARLDFELALEQRLRADLDARLEATRSVPQGFQPGLDKVCLGRDGSDLTQAPLAPLTASDRLVLLLATLKSLSQTLANQVLEPLGSVAFGRMTVEDYLSLLDPQGPADWLAFRGRFRSNSPLLRRDLLKVFRLGHTVEADSLLEAEVKLDLETFAIITGDPEARFEELAIEAF